MEHTHAYIIPFRGGIVSPGQLNTILDLLTGIGVSDVRFGLRQDMIVNIPAKQLTPFVEACNQHRIPAYPYADAPPNIVSSYPAVNIAIDDTWLREGGYKDVFDLFDYTPRLKVNICDQQQTFVPLFTGHINWITSSSAHYWHLCIRFPKGSTYYYWPELVYTNDIARVSKALEHTILRWNESGQHEAAVRGSELHALVRKRVTYIAKPQDEPIQPPRFALLYYEGFNKSDNTYWLGIYRRNELFSVSFLKDICLVCQQTKVAQLYTTPWKSIVIKDIAAGQRALWGHVLSKHRINVRHAANELNWQIEDNKDDVAALKQAIIHYFDRGDVRTYGLCFAIQTRPRSSMFGSIVIRKLPDRLKAFGSSERFDILYTKDFNPNANELLSFKKGIPKEAIGKNLVSLCNLFYFHNEHPLDLASEDHAKPASVVAESRRVYQCQACLTVYDPTAGDEAQGIAPDTAFAALPQQYRCPVCEADKQALKEVAAETLFDEIPHV
ncbi:rubredoxin [Parapedobacter sp. DT-150]|uniref:rubredoxin n=1 Tax=Parapedobacter sp. DT-150 TaxID=3396162 RepID=UPI003F1AD95C